MDIFFLYTVSHSVILFVRFSDVLTLLRKSHTKTLCILIAYAWAVNSTRPPTVKPVHVPDAYNEEVLQAIQFNYDQLIQANKTDTPLFTPERAVDSEQIWTWKKIYGRLREIRTTTRKGICWNWTDKREKMFVHYFSVYNVFCNILPPDDSFVGETKSFLDDDMMFNNSTTNKVDIRKVWKEEEKRLVEPSSDSDDESELSSDDSPSDSE